MMYSYAGSSVCSRFDSTCIYIILCYSLFVFQALTSALMTWRAISTQAFRSALTGVPNFQFLRGKTLRSLLLKASLAKSPLLLTLRYAVLFLCSKALPVFNRCTPVDVSCYSKFAEAVVTFVSDNTVLHRLIAGVVASKEIIVGLCLLALGKGLHGLSAAGT